MHPDIAGLVRDIMKAHDDEYDAIVCNPDADDAEMVAAIVVRVLRELRGRGYNAAVEQQAVAYLIRWWFGETALRLFSQFGGILESINVQDKLEEVPR